MQCAAQDTMRRTMAAQDRMRRTMAAQDTMRRTRPCAAAPAAPPVAVVPQVSYLHTDLGFLQH